VIPTDLRDRLLKVLSTLRWPPGSQRKSMLATHYLVLRGGSAVAFYPELNALCDELMAWVGDTDFAHSAVAVTKNFVGSPHVDHLDVSYQYAVSLGCFQGGRLCVEEVAKDKWTTHRINTKDRVARMDGRFVHWVEPFHTTSSSSAATASDDVDTNDKHMGGDRYSLIFYTSTEDQARPVEGAVRMPIETIGAVTQQVVVP
jgi:hypothetical protein